MIQRCLAWFDPLVAPDRYLGLSEPEPTQPLEPRDYLNQLFLRLSSSASPVSGDILSKSIGQGLMFHHLREYTAGDDVRNIDWNVLARTMHPYVREYREEREQPFWVVLDDTASMAFGTTTAKRQLAIEMACILLKSATDVSCPVGLAVMQSRGNWEILPQARGQAQLLRMVNYLQEGKPQADQGTMNRLTLSEDQWLTRMPSLIPRHSWIVVLSDFLDWPIQDEQSSFAKVVHYLATHGRLTSLYIQDHHEVALLQALHPIPVRDSESQQTYWLYVNHSEWRQDYSRANDERIGTQQNRLRKLGPVLTLDTRMPLSECVHRFLGLILPQSDRIPGIPSNAARLSDA